MAIQEGGTFSPNSNIVSPGVFTREFDSTGVAQGVANIGGVIVAPFPKGPAFTPTSFNNVNDLQQTFGTPDGVYYGPYTATEYLNERGLVTVCRVGALTGYKQNYPFIIYAQSGSWDRNNSVGNLDSGSSYMTLVGNINAQYSSSVTESITSTSLVGISANVTASITSSKLTFTNVPIIAKFQSDASDASDLSINSTSGSLLFYGQQLSLGTTTIETPTQNRITFLNSSSGVISSSAASGSQYYNLYGTTLSASLLAGTFSASFNTIQSVTFTAGIGGDTTLTLISSSIYAITGACSTVVLNLKGLISGSFGKYNGNFTTGSYRYDACNNVWITSSTDMRILAVLNDTQYAGIRDLVAPGFSGSILSNSTQFPSTTIGTDFNLTLKNSNSDTPYGVYQFSTDGSSQKYITNVFGKSPTAGDPELQVTGQKIEAAYLYKVFENALTEVSVDPTKWVIKGTPAPDGVDFVGDPLNFTDDYSTDLTNGDSQFSITNATTPWIISQKIAPWQTGGTETRYRLFRVHTLSDGTETNTSYKVEISQVKLAGTVAGSDWGSFTLSIRKYNDTDKKSVYLEQFPNLNLNPDSSNYIARRIGDRYNYIDFNGKIIEFGTFTNNSRHIRIEMIDSLYPETAIPYGFEAFATPINSSAGFWTPTMKYSKASVYSLNPGKYPSGITFEDAPVGADSELSTLYPVTSTGNGASDDNKQYFSPLPVFEGYSSTGRNTIFALDDDYQSYGVGTGLFLSGSNIVPAVYDVVNEPTYIKMRKFVLGFQGGFTGQSPAIAIKTGGNISPGNTQGLDCTNSTSAGSIAYNQCISALGNADEWDINLIVVPGILHQHHPYVTNLVVEMCEKRGDCFFIMDMYSDDGNPSSGQIDEVIQYAGQYDTNYATTYYPWIKILDTNTNKIVMVPPSVVMPSVYAANDKVSAEWFAPAGLNRGGIPIAVQVTDRTTHEERDRLYEGKVNPIAAFPGNGIVVWGQKTLQDADSALNRVSVRRLLIGIKKYFASVSKYLVFEQNVAATRNKFLSIVNPHLESIQQRSGLYAFYVKMDENNNTPDIIDQNILYGQIYLKPTKTSEFIVLDFNIVPTGASFPNG